MQRIRLARIDHSESLLLERNNDCFIQENKNHRKFYHYQSLFEISLILLPIVVALSISLYDHNEETSITIREVYMLLTLLGICYRPLKNLQQVMLKVEDGMHSFKRIEIYLDLPENSSKAKWIKNDADFEPVLKISRNTMTMLRSGAKNKLGTSAGFYSSREVNLHKGQRLIILGRKGQGTTIFLRSLLGEIYTVNGCIKLQGSLAYLPEVNFFRHEDIIKNIAFYDSGVPEEDIKEIYALLGLDVDLKFRKGLEEVVEVGKFSEMELKKIGLARVLCSKREVIILDCPFLGIGVEIGERLEKLLRQRQ
jgi:ABC-type multidrug transport system fused ATPase/permease subunit